MEKATDPGRARIDRTASVPRLTLSGDWILIHYLALEQEVAQLRGQIDDKTIIDLDHVGRLDTSGASLLAELLGLPRLHQLSTDANLPASRRALLQTLGDALATYCQPDRVKHRSSGLVVLERIGAAVERFWKDTIKLLGFIGMVLETLVRTLPRPKQWRVTSLVSHIEQTGLDAVPIVVLLSFMVGAVIAFLGSTALAQFGATIYTVDLLGFAFLREFGVLLTAIVLAGRTASAFTAQIGSMKSREEIDAIRTLGLDPLELLVLPRVLALLVALPLLTFLATIAGVVGGGIVCVAVLNISPALFLSMFQADITLGQFVVGIAKAPVFAFMISIIGCMEGFKVSGSAQSVGEHTTSAVVQSIFVVILIDAIAALFYMEMGW
jgi:phospholipid/cholesterol/gamma-HCH transport system permease protein